MAVLSKLLAEVIVESGVNDKVIFTNSTGTDFAITMNSGIYRDVISLLEELESQANSDVVGHTFSITANSTGYLSFISAGGTFEIDFDTSNYGTSLRDLFGFTVNTVSGSSSYTSNSVHQRGYYPKEPVELDSRPTETGSDSFDLDSYQTQTRTGKVSTKGGTQKVYFRDIGFLLPYTDVDNYANWVETVADGSSFAFYHDRSESWPGPNSEYNRYVMFFGPDPASYSPEPVEGGNRIWYRAEFPMTRYVE